jgi:hypothetical protein
MDKLKSDRATNMFFKEGDIMGVPLNSRLRALLRKLELEIDLSKFRAFLASVLKAVFTEEYIACHYWATGKK